LLRVERNSIAFPLCGWVEKYSGAVDIVGGTGTPRTRALGSLFNYIHENIHGGRTKLDIPVGRLLLPRRSVIRIFPGTTEALVDGAFGESSRGFVLTSNQQLPFNLKNQTKAQIWPS
jgi:hypothetical protein